MDGPWFLLLLLGLAAVTSGNDLSRCPAPVPRDYNVRAFRESCYQFLDHERSWHDAQGECRGRGGHLAVIKDAATQNFFMTTLRQLQWKRNGVWIGAHDQHREMDWKWITGERLDYDNWAAGQPSCGIFCVEDCGQLRYSDGGQWHDYKCDWGYSFICQYKMLPTTTTSTTTTTTTSTTTTTTTTTTPAPTTTLPPKTTSTPDPVKEEIPQVALNVSSVEARPDYRLDSDSLWGDNSSRATQIPPKSPAQGGFAEHHSQEKVETAQLTDPGIMVGVILALLLGIIVGGCLVAFIFIRRRRRKAAEEDLTVSYMNPNYGELTQPLRSSPDDEDGDDDDEKKNLDETKSLTKMEEGRARNEYDIPPSLALGNPTYGQVRVAKTGLESAYSTPSSRPLHDYDRPPQPFPAPPKHYPTPHYLNMAEVQEEWGNQDGENFYEDLDTLMTAVAEKEAELARQQQQEQKKEEEVEEVKEGKVAEEGENVADEDEEKNNDEDGYVPFDGAQDGVKSEME